MKINKKPVEKMSSLNDFVCNNLSVKGQDCELIANNILSELYSHRWDMFPHKVEILFDCIMNNIQVSPTFRYFLNEDAVRDQVEGLVGELKECPEIIKKWDELKAVWEKMKTEREELGGDMNKYVF